MATLREVICDRCREHVVAGNLVMGQCLSAVGFVGGTLPADVPLTELPMADVAGAYFAVGAALAGRRPILVLRYQGFGWYAAAALVNYAAKSKTLWGRPCPVLVRGVAMEGGIGPVAGSSHHSLYHRMPELKIYAPVTPYEWSAAYREFIAGDDPVYLSEHRGSYDNAFELENVDRPRTQLTLFPISITRFAAAAAATRLAYEMYDVSVCHVFRLKPFSPPAWALDGLHTSGRGLVIDDDYPSGVASALATELSAATGATVEVMGLPDRTAGFAPRLDVLPPTAEEIYQRCLDILQKERLT